MKVQSLANAKGIKNLKDCAKNPNKWTYWGAYLKKIGARCLPAPSGSNLLTNSVSDRSKSTSGSGRLKSSESVNLVNKTHNLSRRSKMAWLFCRSLRRSSTWSQQHPLPRQSNTPRSKASKPTESICLRRRLLRRYACIVILWSVTMILTCSSKIWALTL